MKKFVALVMVLSLGLFCAVGCQAKKAETKVEPPKTETKVEEPMADAPAAVEEPKADAPAAAEEPKAEEVK